MRSSPWVFRLTTIVVLHYIALRCTALHCAALRCCCLIGVIPGSYINSRHVTSPAFHTHGFSKKQQDSACLVTMTQHQNGGSLTCVVSPPVELQAVSSYPQYPDAAKTTPGLKISDRSSQDDDPVENLPSPTTQAAEKLERWNQSRTNVSRTFAAFWSFVVMGSNDAAYGALIPYVHLPPPSP